MILVVFDAECSCGLQLLDWWIGDDYQDGGVEMLNLLDFINWICGLMASWGGPFIPVDSILSKYTFFWLLVS